ncbi:hypothetical protein [Ascidiaceihabitans sp.]|uniref:hypothetical protein n=1 Tax=Ascidiaceihabitans sp. TaxID=1872644 RepID=UPI003299A939
MRTQKVDHLKINGGRYYYRRRVPAKHQKTLGVKNWNRPCGKVSYQQAVVLVTKWAAEHDALLSQLDDPTLAEKTRYTTEVHLLQAPMMQVTDTMTKIGMEPDNWRGDVMLAAAKVALQAADQHPEKSSAAPLVGYRSIYALCFNDNVVPPSDLDERDEFDLVKRSLEPRINGLGGNPNTITAMSEAYFKKNQLKTEVRNKYRRVIKRLIAQVGDITLGHLNIDRLREFRDAQPDDTKASSL